MSKFIGLFVALFFFVFTVYCAFAQTIAPAPGANGATTCAGLSDAGALCSSTNASNLTGTVASARVSGAYAGITGLGTLATGAVPTTLLTGALQAAQQPALTGVITTSAGSLTTAFASSTGSGAVVLATGSTLVSAAATQLTVTNLNLVGSLVTAVTTVAGLPACTTALQGARYTVNNALSPVALATVVAGGAIVVGVLCNGTAWIVG